MTLLGLLGYTLKNKQHTLFIVQKKPQLKITYSFVVRPWQHISIFLHQENVDKEYLLLLNSLKNHSFKKKNKTKEHFIS